MDIRNWSLDRILQLPDWCFGRRWPIVFAGELSLIADVINISEFALPDKCVLWELDYTMSLSSAESGALAFVAISLGDHLPANRAEFNRFEPVFGNQGFLNAGTWSLCFGRVHHWRMRLPLAPQGRRFVVYLEEMPGATFYYTLSLLVSSIPTEVPDWLVSR